MVFLYSMRFSFNHIVLNRIVVETPLENAPPVVVTSTERSVHLFTKKFAVAVAQQFGDVDALGPVIVAMTPVATGAVNPQFVLIYICAEAVCPALRAWSRIFKVKLLIIAFSGMTMELLTNEADEFPVPRKSWLPTD